MPPNLRDELPLPVISYIPPIPYGLLDWLAARFVANGWSIKKLHRLILTSRTFSQSSQPRPDALALSTEVPRRQGNS
ncbi:MAG: hypothetical protein M2R45_05206 [Verrucomicrobia subdivision 3 bacterium]|nr:hypothetical protein [Limisphaerales bacterium]MCS1413890.1 hypothetical protein [Limisphaerales bacterium]